VDPYEREKMPASAAPPRFSLTRPLRLVMWAFISTSWSTVLSKPLGDDTDSPPIGCVALPAVLFAPIVIGMCIGASFSTWRWVLAGWSAFLVVAAIGRVALYHAMHLDNEESREWWSARFTR